MKKKKTVRKTPEQKLLENVDKIIKRNIRSGSCLPFAWDGGDGYYYIMVRNCGIVRTINEFPEIMMYKNKKDEATNAETFFNTVMEHLYNDDRNRGENHLSINRTQLKSRISVAKDGKHYAQVEIFLGECVVNAEYLLEIMTACNTNDIYLVEITKPGSTSTITIPYIIDSDRMENPETEAILLPITGRYTVGRHLFDTYLYENT